MHIMTKNSFAFLALAGAASTLLQAAPAEPVTTEHVHAAVAKALPLLQHISWACVALALSL